MNRYLLAIDQGTTGSTALVMGMDGRTLGRESRELPQHFPEPAWVEHDPIEIQASVTLAVSGALRAAGVAGSEILAIGITNQRETTLLWEKASGRPIDRAIVWQDRRTTDACRRLKNAGHESQVRERTGLVLDPYFSATKLAWLLDERGARQRAEAGELAFGTVDSYLIWWLAGGQAGGAPHVIEVSNASRTSLMHLDTLAWDPWLCELFRVPRAVLPRIVPSTGVLAHTRGFEPLPDGVPIAGVAGDQQAALFGQACFAAGDAKCTYGTGAFLVVNTGQERVRSAHGLLSTVAWQIGESGDLSSSPRSRVAYALEGSCFIAGAAVQWLRDGLGLIRSSADVEALARSVASSDGVVFVPALSGLGAPHWDPDARGLICGLTRGSSAGHIARATLEAIAFQVADLVSAMREDLKAQPRTADILPEVPGRPGRSTGRSAGSAEGGAEIGRIRVDGGAAQNNLLMQFQSDVSNVEIERPLDVESTARGAAMLAGVGAGVFRDIQEAARLVDHPQRFQAEMTSAEREQRLSSWQAAVRRARSELDASASAAVPAERRTEEEGSHGH
jgi:glycerol kinase